MLSLFSLVKTNPWIHPLFTSWCHGLRENVPYRVVYLNTSYPVSGTVWGHLGGVPPSWKMSLRIGFSSLSLLHACVWRCVLWASCSTYHPCYCPASPPWWTLTQVNPSFYELLWPWCFLTTALKWLIQALVVQKAWISTGRKHWGYRGICLQWHLSSAHRELQLHPHWKLLSSLSIGKPALSRGSSEWGLVPLLNVFPFSSLLLWRQTICAGTG